MRVLMIKTSSMGDIIHTLPALTDAGLAIPGIQFDWVVEESFAEISSWHPLVNKVIPVKLRQWRKKLFSRSTREAWHALQKELNAHSYDIVIDAQGLVKSALVAWQVKSGVRVGLDFRSARESLASFVYQRKYTVNFYQHAIHRMRQLLSQALGYTLPQTEVDYGLTQSFKKSPSAEKYVVFLHATTWASKQWPEDYWIALAKLAESAGYIVKTSGGSRKEIARAERIAHACNKVEALPRQSIQQMAQLLVNASGVVAVDTGFGHLAAALNVPLVSLYGATNPAYTGAMGRHSKTLAANFPCAPCLQRECTYRKAASIVPACYESLTPQKVWQMISSSCEQRSV